MLLAARRRTASDGATYDAPGAADYAVGSAGCCSERCLRSAVDGMAPWSGSAATKTKELHWWTVSLNGTDIWRQISLIYPTTISCNNTLMQSLCLQAHGRMYKGQLAPGTQWLPATADSHSAEPKIPFCYRIWRPKPYAQLHRFKQTT